MTWRVQGECSPAGGPQCWNLLIPHVVVGEEAGPEQRDGFSGASLIVDVDGAKDGGYDHCDTPMLTVYTAVCTL